MNFDVVLNRALRLVVAGAVLAAVALGAMAVLDRMASDRRAAERDALTQRGVTLTASALTPGSALACLDAGPGDAVENACEAAIFASPQSAAAAVAYIGARLRLIADAHALAGADNALLDGFATERRALELDRFGIAAHVLAARDGCAPERCAAFALFSDVTAVKANMKAAAFDQYVARHAAAWNAPAPEVAPAPAPVAQAPASAPSGTAVADAKTAEPQPAEPHVGELVAHPLSDKYDFPSAASIPPVSIMNSEPALPKVTANAQAAEFKADTKPAANGAPTVPGQNADVPVPPKRPQVPGDAAAPPAQVR